MKTIEEYSKLPYPLELIPDGDEGGFVAVYPDLPGCISLGDTAQEAVTNAADAKLAWLEAALAQGVDIPEPDCVDNYSGQFKLRIPKSLHKSLAEHSKREGISMNQYCLYLLTKNDTEFSPTGT
jgi:predicted RNase H-like HicB family nuclease